MARSGEADTRPRGAPRAGRRVDREGRRGYLRRVPPWRGLYAIVDPERAGPHGAEALAEAVLRGGCAVLQLRAKATARGPLLTLARRLRARARAAGVPFVVNDHADVACLVGADGLHLGQDDLPVPEARRLVGDRPIGVSTHDLGQIDAAVAAGADLVGFGPVFPTTSKARPDPVVGLEGLAEACRRAPVPVVAIGGLDLERAREAARAGAALVAVISALTAAADPEAAAAALHLAVRDAAPR